MITKQQIENHPEREEALHRLQNIDKNMQGGIMLFSMMSKYKCSFYGIDIHEMYKSDYASRNIDKFNINKHPHYFITGSSLEQSTEDKVKDMCPDGIDLLFIDGLHNTDSVYNDYKRYSQFVNPGGVIVFDDYEDYKEVRAAVDRIVKESSNLNVIGQIDNSIGAFSSGFRNNPKSVHYKPLSQKERNNDFIIQKNA